MEIFRQTYPVELRFHYDAEKGAFCWYLLLLSEMDRYYLPLIKKPVLAIKIGMAKLDY